MAEHKDNKPLDPVGQKILLNWVDHEIRVVTESPRVLALGSEILDLEFQVRKTVRAAYLAGYREALTKVLGQEPQDTTQFASELRTRADAVLSASLPRRSDDQETPRLNKYEDLSEVQSLRKHLIERGPLKGKYHNV